MCLLLPLLIFAVGIPISTAEKKNILIVATPPADAGRGLVRISKNEIRHYSGEDGKQFFQAPDNG